MPHCRVDKYHAQYVAALQKLFEDNRHKYAKVGASCSAAVHSTLHRSGAWGLQPAAAVQQHAHGAAA